MSENKWQLQTDAVIKDKLQGTVVTYLKCGGIVNNRIKKCLLLSLPVEKLFKLVTVWYSHGQKRWIALWTFFDF